MMKEKKFYTIILCAVMMIMGITSCSEELLSESDTPNGYPSGEGQVSAVKLEGNGDIFARSSFLNGTKYSLVMFTRGFTATDTSKPVLTTDSVLRYNGLATETALGGGTFQYLVVNDKRHSNNEWFGFRSLNDIDDIVKNEDGRRSLSFYGFTYGKNNAPQLDENVYTCTEKVDEGGELNDLMWGILVDQNDATAKFPCEIPFRHAFSRLEFKVSQLASEENSEDTPKESSKSSPEEGYALQFGVFTSKEAADKLADDLESKGIETEIIEDDEKFKVISPVVKTKDEAIDKLNGISDKEVEDVFIASF